MAYGYDHPLVAWLIALLFVLGLAQYVEKAAALRGSHAKPMSPLVDKALRTVFLLIMVAPVLYLVPWLVLLFLAYLPSYLSLAEKNHGRPSKAVKECRIWYWFKRRLGLELVVPYKMDTKKQYVIGFHPHGVLPFGSMINLGAEVNEVTKKLSNMPIRFLAASMCFFVPGYRDLVLGGGVCDAARPVAKRLLADGYSIALCPGGATEALYAEPGVDTLVLRKRRGFISLAMQTGSDLIPVFSFNENDTYGQLATDHPWLQKVRRKFQAITGLSLPLVTNILPRKCNITTVFGEPIQVEKVEKPTTPQIDAVLEVYIANLTKLYHDHHAKYSPGRKPNLTIL